MTTSYELVGSAHDIIFYEFIFKGVDPFVISVVLATIFEVGSVAFCIYVT